MGLAFSSSKITSFPSIDVSGVTNFINTFGNSTLTTFPQNMFDTTTVTNFDTTFLTTNLDAASKENIVTSLVTSGGTNGKLRISGGAPPNAATVAAVATLTGSGWTVTVT